VLTLLLLSSSATRFVGTSSYIYRHGKRIVRDSGRKSTFSRWNNLARCRFIGHGVAAYTATALSRETHNISATYEGTLNYLAGTANVQQVVR
jgi:hypothetical protein